MRILLKLALVLAPAFMFLAGLRGAAPTAWPGWRGPNQDGHSLDARVPLRWSQSENLAWQVELPGTGNSSPVVWGDRVFLTAATGQGAERLVLCIDRKVGKVLWQRTAAKGLPPEPVHEWNTHASATCATDGARVYAFFGTPGLFCYDCDGKLLWKKEFGTLASSTGWGAGAASPMLFDDLVIVNGDHGAKRGQVNEQGVSYGSSWLWALDKRTGDVVWKTERNQGMGWCTPIIWANNGRKELVLNGQLGVWSYDPRTGKELWHVVGRQAEEGFGEVTPIWGHGLLFIFTGKPGPAWAIRPGGRGDVSKTHVAWQIKRSDRDVSSPILVGDYLYTVSRIGIATCLEARTGKEVWRQRLGGQPCASMICVHSAFPPSPLRGEGPGVRGEPSRAGGAPGVRGEPKAGKVIFLSDDGTASVIEPGPTFKLLHKNKLGDGDDFRASPAVADGQLLIRSARRLYCIGESDKKGAKTKP